QRGGKFVRHFTIDRGGFAGPLTVRLADKQARHLQGVTGPTIEDPAGASEFDYPVFLPPWMEIGRTNRTVVMAMGEVADADAARPRHRAPRGPRHGDERPPRSGRRRSEAGDRGEVGPACTRV